MQFVIAGNADTRVAATYFWYPLSFSNPPIVTTRADGDPMVLMPEQLVAGGINKLGFHFSAIPKVQGNTSLVVIFAGSQLVGTMTRHSEVYQYQLQGSENEFVMSDGVTVAA